MIPPQQTLLCMGTVSVRLPGIYRKCLEVREDSVYDGVG